MLTAPFPIISSSLSLVFKIHALWLIECIEKKTADIYCNCQGFSQRVSGKITGLSKHFRVEIAACGLKRCLLKEKSLYLISLATRQHKKLQYRTFAEYSQ
jgi:hypothetical protein